MDIQLNLKSDGVLEKPISHVNTHKKPFEEALKKAGKQQEINLKEDEKLKKACADFEAVLINFMFKSMKKSLPGNNLFGDGFQKDIYDSLFFQEIATKLARERGLGMGESLYRQLKNKVK